MRRLTIIALIALVATPLYAASGRQPAPQGAPADAPAQFTRFTTGELMRGFMALAFGSDLRVGVKPRGIRRFDREIRAYVDSAGSVDRKTAMERIIAEYARKVPRLSLSTTVSEDSADLVIHLIDERNFAAALERSFGRETARAFVRKTDPQCMTSVKSQPDGGIVSAVSFVIVDKGEDVFLDCAYHELLHAFGLSNHDQRNPWTTLNQNRRVGYLSVYDQTLLTLLYDPQLKPGMTPPEVRKLLPSLIAQQSMSKPR
jgi:hypothetical protein